MRPHPVIPHPSHARPSLPLTTHAMLQERAQKEAGSLKARPLTHPVEVQLSISEDSMGYAFKTVQLGPITYESCIQLVLDSFLLSHLEVSDFILIQRLGSGDSFDSRHMPLPASQCPLFALDKSGEPPYRLYLQHYTTGAIEQPTPRARLSGLDPRLSSSATEC